MLRSSSGLHDTAVLLAEPIMRFAVPIVIALSAACQRKDDRAAPPPSETSRASDAGHADLIDVHGITVRFLADGGVQIRGNDRWGNSFDATYESLEYFRGALPVLERSVTPEQAAGLRKIAGS